MIAHCRTASESVGSGYNWQRGSPALCHVWTAPAVQEESDVSANGRVRSCIRSFIAAIVAADHDVIRGSGPIKSTRSLVAWHRTGFPDQRSTVSHHVVFTPAMRERYRYMAVLPIVIGL